MARMLGDSHGIPASQSNEASQSSNGSESCSGTGSGSGSASASASASASGSDSEPQNSGRTAPTASTPLKQPPPPTSQPSEQHQNPPPSQPPSRLPSQPPLHTTAGATTTAANNTQKPAPTAAVLPHRPKSQKHVVGGGGSTARLHARVPSSKALFNKQNHTHSGHNQNHGQTNHHHAVPASATKLAHHRRQSSFSPPIADLADRFPFAAVPPPINASSASQNPQQQHRRATSSSDAKLTRNPNSSSASSLVRKNVSSSSLKRNRSHADVVKRNGHGSRPTAQLKRANSNPAVAKTQHLASAAKRQSQQVHFEIGSPDAQDQDDEWVDAGSSTVTVIETPNYNRLVPKPPRNETDAGEEKATDNNNNDDYDSDDAADDVGSDSSVERRPPRQQKQIDAVDRASQPSAGESTGQDILPPPLPQQPQPQSQQQPSRSSSPASTLTSQHRTNSTSKLLLPRTPPRGAPPMMSTETASASMRPDSSSTDSSPPKLPRLQPQIPGGSSERDAMTSRFITSVSHESGSASGHTGGDSYYTTSSSQPSSSVRHLADDRDAASSSNTNVSVNAAALAAYARGSRVMNGGEPLTDDEDSGIAIGAGRQPAMQQPIRMNGRRTRPPHAPPAELSRTQQKLNLERASSGLDRNNHQHAGPSTGALLGAGGFGTHDPRIVKLMEKTGMEYYVVRRYQNPVTRSLGRLAGRLGGDWNWRIPAASNGHSSHRSTISDADRPATASENGSRSSAALSQSFRERDIRRDVLHHTATAAANAPLTVARTRTFPAAAVGGGGLGDPPVGAGEHSRRLSGASLVDSHADDEGTAALLRNLWEKNLYLGTSQD